jgi:hypothetical protein
VAGVGVAGGTAPGVNSQDSGVGGIVFSGGYRIGEAALPEAISGPSGNDPFNQLSRLAPMASLVSTTTTLTLALMFFTKKRRDEDATASDEDLAASAASPFTGGSGFAPAFAGVDPGTGGTDVNLPRWRRPSLLAARKSDPIRNGADHVSLTFDGGGVSAAGAVRMEVRYRLVQLLDRPDEILGLIVDSLDQGDQVEVVERHGTYRRVLTPDGREGWLHRMTLGEIVPDVAPARSSEQAGDDVLLAYLSAHVRG